MESLKEKLWRWQKKIKEQQNYTNKELYPIFKEIEEFQKRAKEIKQEFDKLWYREWEDFIFNEWVVKTDEEWDSYINFMWNNYWINGLRWKLYEVKKDDNGEWYIYIWWTDPSNYMKWSWNSFILKSDWFIYNWSHFLWWWNWVRFAPNWMIYSWSISKWEPLNPDEESRVLSNRKWSYYEPNWRKTTYKVTPPLSEELNLLQDKPDEKSLMYSRGKVVETTIEEIWKTIEHYFSSWNVEIKFNEEDQDYVFRTHRWREFRIPLEKWKDFIASTADFINSAISLSKKEWFIRFNSDEEDLTVSYRLRPRNTSILRNVKEKFWIDAKDLAQWLNDYIHEDKYKEYDTPKERWRPKKSNSKN